MQKNSSLRRFFPKTQVKIHKTMNYKNLLFVTIFWIALNCNVLKRNPFSHSKTGQNTLEFFFAPLWELNSNECHLNCMSLRSFFLLLLLLASYMKMPLQRDTPLTWPFYCHNTLRATAYRLINTTLYLFIYLTYLVLDWLVLVDWKV